MSLAIEPANMGVMGTLKESATGVEVLLPTSCLIGRGAHAVIRLDRLEVSNEHATLRWVSDHWEVRDLGSKNGTFKADLRLAPGGATPLALNDRVRFGNDSEWYLSDVSAPTMLALNLTTGATLCAASECLCLPNERDPVLSAFRDVSGHWVLETDTEQRAVSHGEVVICDGEQWKLLLPDGVTDTAESRAAQASRVGLRFGVSSDEEHVALEVDLGATVTALPARTHHYLLLTLARLKQGDLEAGVAASDAGWVHVDKLARMLGNDSSYVNLCVHRLRRQLVDHGLSPAVAFIERRQTQGQLRLGPVAVEIARL